MKKVFRSRRMWVALVVLTVFACVTINIYFPAEKVESVASEIVKDIRGAQPDRNAPGDSTPQSAVFDFRHLFAAGGVAWAQDAVNVSNPAIRALKSRMKQRFEQLKPYYAAGNLVEKDDGYLAEGKVDGLDLKARRNLKGLIEAENRDRSELYREVASALNIDASQAGRIGEIFAKEWKKPVR